jgi:hypothetical protein
LNRMRNFFVFILIITLTGCLYFSSGRQKTKEKFIEKKKEIENIESIYRPKGERPKLPLLDENSDISDFIKYAILNNPKIEAEFYSWKEEIYKLASERFLPEPRISFEGTINSILEELMAGIMFMFPKSEKIPLSFELYSLEAENKRLNFEYEILKTIYKVKDISYRYYLIEKKIKFLGKIVNLLEEIEKINISKLKVAKASEKDILRIQIEKEQMKNMLLDMIDSKNYILREFASVLGIPTGEKIPEPPRNLKFTDESFSETEIWKIVKDKNPKLLIMENEIKKAEIFIKLAYREYYPEMETGIMRNFFSSMIVTKPLITLSLPWREKVKYQIYSAESSLKIKKAEYSSELLELATILSEALFRWRQANREKNLYEKNLLPKAESVFYLTKSNYITGLSDIDEFLISERNYYEFNINYLSAVVLREITLNEISLIIAGIMPEWS